MVGNDEKEPVPVPVPTRKGDPRMKQQILAMVTQNVGRRYPALMLALDDMDDAGLREFIQMLRAFEGEVLDAQRKSRRGF
jgi:hypothetical protein